MENDWFINYFDKSYEEIYFDSIEENFNEKQTDFIISFLSLKGKEKILDTCCGTGRHAIEFSKRGYKVTGIDLNEEYIKVAQEASEKLNLNTSFKVLDIRNMGFDKEFDVALNLWTSFGYFDDFLNLKALNEIYKSLKNGGLFLLDLENRDYILKYFIKETWKEYKNFLVLEKRDFNIMDSVLKTKRIIYKNGIRKEYARKIRMYTFTELKNILNSTGFEVKDTKGSYEGKSFTQESSRMIIKAQKR